MTKIVLENLASIQNDPTAVDKINDNSDKIVVAIENTLSRNGETPNQMESNLDMNGNRILNLPRPMYQNEPARLKDIGNAYQYAQDAAQSAAEALVSEQNAKTSENAAKASEENAEDSADAAALSAAAALVSKNNAATSESNAHDSELAAAQSESNAHTSEVNAGISESNAFTSESNAATSESNAHDSELAAAQSASDASDDADSAALSAATATTQAGIATTQAGNAATSASNAHDSEVAAATSESNAATSESNAATSETNAHNSELAAATSESNAHDSELAAATSESNAHDSELAAALFESNAATSETNAQNSLEDFENIYLGSYSSDPSVTPTGDPVAVGMLYWNTSTDALKIYDGSSWVSYNPSSVAGVQSVVGGTDITIDNTDPANPIINYSGSSGGVTSFNARTGAVVPASGDYNFNQLSGNISTSQMNSGTSASSSTYWRGDGTWASPAGGVTSVFGRTGAVVAEVGDYDPWGQQPIGVPIPILDNISGTSAPSTSSAYRYIKLTASDSYNTGVLTSESVSGSAPLVVATAVISLSGSPINGATVNLINTERRVLRGGSAGTVEQDALQNITASVSAAGAAGWQAETGAFLLDGNKANPPQSVSGTQQYTRLNFDASRVARTGTETRSKNIGVTYFMRIL